MKKLTLLIITVLLSSILFAQKNFDYHKDFKKLLDKSQKTNSKYNYESLLIRFLNSDTTLTNYELLALQIGHTASDNYKPYKDIEIEQSIYDLNDMGKYNAALELANSFENRNPLSLMLNLEKSYALYKIGLKDSSDIYYKRYSQLVNSILSSGNGTDIPYFVLGPIDGQILIKRYWQNEITVMGSDSDKNGYFIDVLTMKDEETNEITILKFNIDHAANKMFDE